MRRFQEELKAFMEEASCEKVLEEEEEEVEYEAKKRSSLNLDLSGHTTPHLSICLQKLKLR